MIKSIEAFVHVLRISIAIILLVVGIPALFFNDIIFAGIISIIVAIIIIPKTRIKSQYINTNPFFEFIGVYLVVDWFFNKFDK